MWVWCVYQCGVNFNWFDYCDHQSGVDVNLVCSLWTSIWYGCQFFYGCQFGAVIHLVERKINFLLLSQLHVYMMFVMKRTGTVSDTKKQQQKQWRTTGLHQSIICIWTSYQINMPLKCNKYFLVFNINLLCWKLKHWLLNVPRCHTQRGQKGQLTKNKAELDKMLGVNLHFQSPLFLLVLN